MKLDQVSAVVTGAAGGIGERVCHRLALAGARLLLVGRSPERLGALADTLAALPDPRGGDTRRSATRERIDVLAVDLTQASGRQSVRDAASARQANVLVHGAAIPSFGRLDALDDRHLEQVMQTDLIAPIALTRLLLPVLRAAPEASILTIGSTLGRIGLPGFTVYGAAKSGVRAFNEALRRELGGGPLKVQYLGARATRTGFNDARVEQYNRQTGTATDAPDRVAAAAVAMLVDGRAERHLGFPERFFASLNALVPTWLDNGFARHRAALEQLSRRPPVAANSPSDARPINAASADPLRMVHKETP